MTAAVYPGSFDPFTYGHLDVVVRAARLFDRLVVCVLVNTRKTPLLSAEQRVAVIRSVVDEALGEAAGRVEIAVFEGLTVDFVRRSGATVIVRGLRSSADLDGELPMAQTNRALAPDVETVFLATSPEQAFVSSTLVREIALLGGDVRAFVPPEVARALAAREPRLAP